MCNSGECKWEATFKSIQLQKKSTAAAGEHSRRDQRNGHRRLEGRAAAVVAEAGELRKCAREAERAEKLVLLVCWGPN